MEWLILFALVLLIFWLIPRWSRIKLTTTNYRKREERLYEQVAEELKDGIRKDGLWAKSIAESNGNEGEAKSRYIRLRMQSLKDDEKQDSLNKENEK